MIKYIEIAIQVKRKTVWAILVDYGGKEHVWIPLSQVSDYTEEKDGVWTSVFIPEWLALEKGMI